MCRSEHVSVVNLLVVAVSWPVRGVLSSGPLPGSRWVTIHLCGPPEGFGRAAQPSLRPCSGWGLPIRPGRPGRWCALTAPFHPYLCPTLPSGHRRSALCCPVPSGRPDLALASTLPGGAPTFLSDLAIAAATRPAHRHGHIVATPGAVIGPEAGSGPASPAAQGRVAGSPPDSSRPDTRRIASGPGLRVASSPPSAPHTAANSTL